MLCGQLAHRGSGTSEKNYIRGVSHRTFQELHLAGSIGSSHFFTQSHVVISLPADFLCPRRYHFDILRKEQRKYTRRFLRWKGKRMNSSSHQREPVHLCVVTEVDEVLHLHRHWLSFLLYVFSSDFMHSTRKAIYIRNIYCCHTLTKASLTFKIILLFKRYRQLKFSLSRIRFLQNIVFLSKTIEHLNANQI